MRCTVLRTLLFTTALLSSPRAEPAANALDSLATMAGMRIDIPYRDELNVGAGTCLEVRVLETGSDVRVSLSVDDVSYYGADANVGRHGLQVLVVCADDARRYVANVEYVGTPAVAAAGARWTQRAWTAADGGAYAILRDFATAQARYADPAAAADVAAKLAATARRFDAIGDAEHTAIAWAFAHERAEAGLDRTLAATAFDAAIEHLQTVGWTRYRVVALNNRALFVAPTDARDGLRLIDVAFALQAQLADPQLAATVENNVCLIRYQYSALANSEACFARVLDQHIALGSSPAAIGAARSNVAWALLSQGRYREAEAGFRSAARERIDGNDKRGYVATLCNLALALYQLGMPEAALMQLHDAYATAKADASDVGRAQAAQILASIYLAWGDSDTALAYATEAEDLFRAMQRIADLASTMRLRARIAQDQGDDATALATIHEAWDLAVGNELYQAAANIASVYALILLDTGDFDAAAHYIDDARQRLAPYFGASDLAALETVELRLLRERGRFDAARRRIRTLEKTLPYPGLARSRLSIERHLVAAANAAKLPAARTSYRSLLAGLRSDVAVAPDPELAYRLQELVRPAAEDAIVRELANCVDASCAAQSLQRALEFFALEPKFTPADTGETSKLSGLLQALSQRQASDGAVAERDRLIVEVKRQQARSRRQRAEPAPSTDCTICRQVDTGSGDLVYFFGDSRGWRWQRSKGTWIVRELPPWRTLNTALRAGGTPTSRRAALRELAPLVAALEPLPGERLVVRGDPRLLRVPFAALTLDDGEAVVQRYATSIALTGARGTPAPSTVAFANGSGGGPALPMIAEDRRALVDWTQRYNLTLSESAAPRAEPFALLHIAGHGRGDVGAGMSVVWLQEVPLLSYLAPATRVADTVVINTCESGAAPERGLAQASIAAAFLRNGASNVVATLFPVPDRVAANFARAFYAQYDPRRGNLATAVREAQLTLRKRRGADEAWAAYSALVVDDTVPTQR